MAQQGVVEMPRGTMRRDCVLVGTVLRLPRFKTDFAPVRQHVCSALAFKDFAERLVHVVWHSEL